MRILRTLTLIGIFVAGPGFAQTDISGTWTGDLTVAPGSSLEIHFILSRDGDGYSAVLTSPDQGGIQDLPATSANFDGVQLELVVDALQGRYEGTLEGGSFSGNWYQLDTAIPLNLEPFTERVLSDADKAMLDGSWIGELSIQGTTLAIVFRFETDDAGQFVGFLDSPDQGANGVGVANIEIDNGELSFDIPQIGGRYVAVLTAESMQGTFSQVGMTFPLNMTRGQYVSRGLELSQEAFARLEGPWHGSVQSPTGANVTVVFRFEANDDGGFAGYLDSPDQGATGIPIGEVTVEGDQLSLVIPAARASFTATLEQDQIVGSWAQGNFSNPLTMMRGQYVPSAVPLDLSDDAYGQLAGTWRGTMGPLEIIVRFETAANGSKVAFLDVPAQGASGMTIPEASLSEGTLVFRLPALGVTYEGTLSGGTVTGQWAQGPGSNPLTLTRDQ